MAWNCKFNFTNSNYRKVSAEVKEALGNVFNPSIFKTIADSYSGDISSLTKEYVLQHWPRESAPQEKISRESTKEIAEMPATTIVQYSGKWTRRDVAKPENKDKLFIFTDNTDRNSGNEPVNPESRYAQKYGKVTGENGEEKVRILSYPKYKTSAVIRGLDNAMPVSTQRWYHQGAKGETGRWTNADVEEFKKVIHQEIDDIIEEWNTGKYNSIVLPQGGLLAETDITDLNGSDRTRIKVALEEEVKRLYATIGVPYTSEAAQMEKSEEQQRKEAAKASRHETRQNRIKAVRWDRYAGDNQGIEVSSAGDEFGRQFSALAAVFTEGTTITISRGGKRKGVEQTFDIGGYSIEAAYQMIKGYTRNPKGSLIDKEGKVIVKINGKDKAPISNILKIDIFRNNSSARAEVEEFSYNTAYLPLWKTWAKQNREKVNELRKKAKDKILTDKFAGTRVSQARALAEILWGTPKQVTSERQQTHYGIQRQNAVRATQQINRTVKSINKPEGIKLLARQDNSDQHIANLVRNLNDKEQQTTDNKLILSFSLSKAAMSPILELFINPFEDEKDEKKAVNKFIQWIIPNDFNSLPDELRKNEEQRDKIRRYLAKGGYKKYTIITDGSSKNAIYARTLHYIIDNFEELRDRYNPVDIQDFGLNYHKVKVTTEQTNNGNENRVMRFSPNELAENKTLDSSNSMQLERVIDNGGNTTESYILTFPDNFDSYTKNQKDRLFKTIAMAVPEGYTLTIDPAIATDSMIDFFKKVIDRGYTKVGEKQVTTDTGITETIGIFKRNGYRKEQVITKPLYNLDAIKDNVDPNEVYLVETDVDNMSNIKHPQIFGIPTAHNNHRDKTTYWDDSGFNEFKVFVDRAMKKARNAIDNGMTVIVPKGDMGSGNAALKHYAPKCFEYLNQQIEELKEYGNREHFTRQFLQSSSATVEAIESSPSESISLDPQVLQSPRAKLRQVFLDVEIHDMARYMAREFLRRADSMRSNLVYETNEKLASAKNADDIDKLKRKLDKLQDPNKGLLYAISEFGIPAIQEQLKSDMKIESEEKPQQYQQKYIDAMQPDIFELIFEYAIPFIEDESGIRINMVQKTAQLQETEANQNDKAEDTEGENTPEMIWSYQHRLVDPYKSLTKNIRKIISSIPMRDPNNPDGLNNYLTDSIGQTKYWDAQYIYHSIMSRMARMPLQDIENFMTIIPVEQLNDRQKRNYPLGMPSFPVLESMRTQYPWADDIIKQLRLTYSRRTCRDDNMSSEDILNSPVAIASIGNVASQFYANFTQQYVPYCIMVNGSVLEENKPTGASSMRQAAITNYQGNVRFPGIDMVYNSDGSVNTDNVITQLARLDNVLNHFKSRQSDDFWAVIDKLQKDYAGESYYDMFAALPQSMREQVIKPLTDILKSCGIVMTEFDLFLGAVSPIKNIKLGFATIDSLAYELKGALEAIKGLPEGEHMFESSYKVRSATDRARSFETPEFYWKNFFRKFGDMVSSREYESSFRSLGKSRYSYTSPSFMSNAMLNLMNPDDEVRRKYIEENFMPYDWFYDKTTGKFRNEMLESLYDGKAQEWGGSVVNPDGKTTGRFGNGHDVICKKDGGKEKAYSEWTPSDIYELMFRELSFPSNTESGCFLIPVLSDSQICKTIQGTKKMGISTMSKVVMQELERMKLVEKRNLVFRMQDIEDKMGAGHDITPSEKTFFNSNLEFYQKYKTQHPEKLQEVENFDKNGSKFCFFPELNDYEVSMSRARATNNEFMQKLLVALSKNPDVVRVNFKDLLTTLQNMTDDFFRQRAEVAGISERRYGNHIDAEGNKHFGEYFSTTTKQEAIEQVITIALNDIMDEKVSDWFWDYKPSRNHDGRINEAILNAIIKNNEELRNEYDRVWVEESENAPMTTAQREAKADFVAKVYKTAKEFYINHTAVMSQFIQLMVTDTAYYVDPTTFKGSVDFAKRWKQVYGAGTKLNTNSKFGKKTERNIILADTVRRSHSFDVFKEVLQEAVNEGRILDVESDAVVNKMKGIKGTDGQAFRSLTSFRDLMDMLGRNNEELASAITNLRQGTWTMKDFYTVFNTVKPFSFGPEDQDSGIGDIRMRTMVQHKNSEAILLAIYDTLVGSKKGDTNYSAKLRGINRAMEDIELVDENGNVMTYQNGEHMKAIDVVQYHSAVKVGAHGIIDINYSRDKLVAARERGGIKVGGKEVDVATTDTYYDVERKLANLLDSGEISFEDYEEAMDWFEPDEDEVFNIIHDSIYKNGDESLGYDSQVLHSLPYAYYCVQQPTDDHYTDEDEGTFGSQPRHIIMADLPNDFEIEINGKKYNREGIRERYNSLIIANLLDCYEKEIEPLFKDTGVKSRRSALERLRDRLMPIIDGNPKYGKQMKDALQIVGPKGQETFALPLNNPTLTGQLEEIFTSLFKNAIHKQKIAGGNVILAADVGYSDKLKVIGKRDKNGKLTSIEGVECLLPAHSRAMFEPYLDDRTDENGEVYYVLDPQKMKEAGLDKLIGYRIPTEGLYSIMPLIVKGFLPQQSGSSIVVAQEITTLTGSDNDVDKLYLMMKAIDDNLNPIKTPSDIHVLEMTKAQRDNEIVDIFFGITTHPKMTHLWAHPGNFDTLTLNAKRLRILKNPSLRAKFIKNAGLDKFADARDVSGQAIRNRLVKALSGELTPSQYDELYRRVMEKDEGWKPKDGGHMTLMDVVVDFTNKYNKPLSPCYPDTFVEMHQSYMAGVAEKGIFANNTLDHAKLQWANVRLLPTHTFTFEGTRIEKLDERTVSRKKKGKTYQHYISSDCAELGAAAVDNGKDPVLADVNSNKQTATFYGFMIRLGIGIDGASLLLSQPLIDSNIRNYGTINNSNNIQKALSTIKSRLTFLGFDIQDERFDWHTHNFTNEELYQNIVGDRLYDLLHNDTKDNTERLASLYRTYSLILELKEMNDALRETRNVIHYDSPTHAADTSIGGVIEQVKAVEQLNDKEFLPEFDRYFTGEDQLLVYELEKKTSGKKKEGKKYESLKEAARVVGPKYQLFNALMGSELPITQAFYTLGIEKIRTELAPQFAFGRPEMQGLVDKLWKLMEAMGIRYAENRREIIKQMFRDWVNFQLSKTEMFGSDGNMTFDQKRQYYLYDYPAKFIKLKETMPELNEIDAIRRMSVKDGMIRMDRQGKTTITLRDFITDSFDELQQSKNPEVQQVAKDLFMYTYYLNGFEFSYMSFGNMFGTEFQRAFPEYIKALQDMNTEAISDTELDRFFEQFIVKRGNMGLVPTITYLSKAAKSEGLQQGFHNTGKPLSDYDSIDSIPEFVFNQTVAGNKIKQELLQFSPELSQLYGTVIYVPLRTNTTLHYNAKQTLDEMMDVVYDEEKVRSNGRLGTKRRNQSAVQYDRYQSTSSQKETSNSRDNNVPEPDDNSVSKAAIQKEELEDGGDGYMDKAVGSVSVEEGEASYDDYDKAMQNKKIASATQKEDSDIAEARQTLMDSNNGVGLCV